ncbi:MAG: MarR family winged helix-turn-helix transcriptional regulator [Clostridiaceae bacterium]|jgi:MarR family transcriptional regulator, organic hydroperoxide resistance regulator|nr:MarR family winged helix-turn-helix transcriptional regulator [Clostridiaceae bacterium]
MNDSIALISRIRENANKLIVKYLNTNGIEGLVPSHGDILAFLISKKQCTMNELAQSIHRTKATTTVLVDKLEKFGFLERQKSVNDSRVTFLTLTEKGQNFKPIFEKISKDLIDKLYQGFTNDEIIAANKLLKKMLKNIE